MQKLRKREGEGFNRELQEFADIAAEDALRQIRMVSAQAGAPFGAVKLGEDEQILRMNDWEDAAKYEKNIAQMTNADLVRATVQAVNLRKKWMAEGKWSPATDAPAPYDQASPLGSPLAPPAATEAHQDPNPGVVAQQVGQQMAQLGLPGLGGIVPQAQ